MGVSIIVPVFNGGRLVYLGGNGLNCEVSLRPDGVMVAHNGKLTGLWPDGMAGAESRFAMRCESEANLLGVVFTPAGAMTGAPYRVLDGAHWAFAGTGLKAGDKFGNKDTIVGYECDGCELVWKDGLPYPTHRDGTPENFQVLATCPARWHPDDCEWYEKWEKGRIGNAVLGAYTRGGTVVTVGSTDWSHGLRGNDAVVVRITKNVLDRLGK